MGNKMTFNIKSSSLPRTATETSASAIPLAGASAFGAKTDAFSFGIGRYPGPRSLAAARYLLPAGIVRHMRRPVAVRISMRAGLPYCYNK